MGRYLQIYHKISLFSVVTLTIEVLEEEEIVVVVVVVVVEVVSCKQSI